MKIMAEKHNILRLLTKIGQEIISINNFLEKILFYMKYKEKPETTSNNTKKNISFFASSFFYINNKYRTKSRYFEMYKCTYLVVRVDI